MVVEDRSGEKRESPASAGRHARLEKVRGETIVAAGPQGEAPPEPLHHGPNKEPGPASRPQQFLHLYPGKRPLDAEPDTVFFSAARRGLGASAISERDSV